RRVDDRCGLARARAAGARRARRGLERVLLEERPLECGRALVVRARVRAAAETAGPAVAHAAERAQLDLTAGGAAIVDDARAVLDLRRRRGRRTAVVCGPCGRRWRDARRRRA